MPLVISRKEGEAWREVAKRYAAKHGLENEVLAIFDAEVAHGVDPSRAAFDACCE